MQMKYKNEIWRYFIRFVDEKKFIEYKNKKNGEKFFAFNDMAEDKFKRMLNTLCWIKKLQSDHINFSFDIELKKPDNEDILEVIEYIEKDAKNFYLHAKQYPDKDLRSTMLRKAKRELDCVNYYRQLVNDDFFKNKEVKESKNYSIENEKIIEIPKFKD